MIDVSPHDLKTIQSILAARVPGFEVRAYGSRYHWSAKEYSDLDLAIVGDRPVPPKEMANLRADFEDSDLPFRVDVLDWQTISPEFRRVIEDGYETIQKRNADSEPPNWKTDKLMNLCTKIGSGATPRGGKESYLEAGAISLIRSQNVLDFFFSAEGLAFIDQGQADELSNVTVQKRDVLLNITGDSVARVCQVPDALLPARVNQHVSIIRPDSTKLIPEYLKYFLLTPSFKNHMLAMASAGATRPALTKGMVENFDIDLPPIAQQRAITHILGTLDDKIELNRRMNETLEAIARALFKSWFVDFDPVRAKAEGRQPVGMDAETAALFPDSFEDSEMGEIPRGWLVVRLGQHVDAEKGLSYSGAGLSKTTGIPMHNLNSVYEGGGYKYEGIKFYTGEYKERHLLSPGEIIVTNTEQGFKYLLIGYPAIVPKYFGEKGIFSHHIFGVRPKNESHVTLQFIYHLLLTPFVREQVIACTNGTTVNMLSVDGLRTPKFVLPPPELIDEFESIAAPVSARIEANYKEAQTLVELRDMLLPKLISGEVRIGHVRTLVLDS